MAAIFDSITQSLRLLSTGERRYFFALMSARVLVNLIDVAAIGGVALFGSMLAAGLTGSPRTSFLGFTIPLTDTQIYLWVVSGVVALFLVKSMFSILLLRATGLFLARAESRAAETGLRFAYGAGLSRLKSFSPEKIHWSVSTSTSMVYSHILMHFSSLVAEISLFAMLFVAFAITDWTAALMVALYFAAVLGSFQLFVNHRLAEAGKNLRHTHQGVLAILTDTSRIFRELLLVDRLPIFIARFSKLRELEARTFARLRFFEGSPRFLIESALMVGLLGLVAAQFANGNLSNGLVTTTVFFAGGLRMMGALLPLQNALSWLRSATPQAVDAQELLQSARSEPPESGEPEKAPPPANHSNVLGTAPIPGGAALRLDSVTFRYPGAEKPAIHQVSIEVPEGHFVAVIGPSGGGKTTLADLALGLLTPDSGSVLLWGQSPLSLRTSQPGMLSCVPQNPGVVAGSIVDNVALGHGQEEADVDRVRELLRAVNLLGELPQSSSGEPDLFSPIEGLSGGQQQRLGLARALYTKPRFLVLDEPTSALDGRIETEIMAYLESLRGRITLLVIAHRMSTIRNADDVFVVEDGRIVAQGPSAKIRQQSARLD